MPSLNIDNLIQYPRFSAELNSDQTTGFFTENEYTYTQNIKGLFTGKNPITDRVFQILSHRVDTILKSKDNSFDSPNSAKIVAKTVLSECGVSHRDLSDVASVRRVFAKLEDPNFFYVLSNNTEKFDLNPSQEVSTRATATDVIKVLMGAPMGSINLTLELLKGVAWEQNKELLGGFLDGLQFKISEASRELRKDNLSENDEKLLVAVLGNLLSIVPFAEPEPGHRIIVPQKIEGTWTDIEYQTETLLLTPKKYGSQVPAFGMKPTIDDRASPLMLFRGTPQPSASGSLPATFSDIIPFYSVGEYIYEKYSKVLIQDWINACEKKVKVFGQSLGGSLSLIAMVNQPDKISEVYVYGTPSLLMSTMSKYEANLRMKNIGDGEKPIVHIYWNNRDIVPLTGHGFHRDWKIHKVIIPRPQDPLRSHAFIHTAFKNVVVVDIDPEVDSRTSSRKTMVIFHHIMSCLLLPFIFLAIQLLALYIYIRKKVINVEERFKEDEFLFLNKGDATLVQAKPSVLI